MSENTFSFEIPAQTRSIYIDYDNYIFNPNIVRHKLNLPKFLVKKQKFDATPAWTIVAVNEAGELCYVPFTNILKGNIICLGDVFPFNEKEFIEIFFNTKFTMTGPYHIFHYFKKYKNQNFIEISVEMITNFYKNWEKTGTLELVKIGK